MVCLSTKTTYNEKMSKKLNVYLFDREMGFVPSLSCLADHAAKRKDCVAKRLVLCTRLKGFSLDFISQPIKPRCTREELKPKALCSREEQVDVDIYRFLYQFDKNNTRNAQKVLVNIVHKVCIDIRNFNKKLFKRF